MTKQVIAADYDNVKAALAKMDNEISEIVSAIKTLQTTIDSTEDWKGLDATAYKAVLRNYANRINNSTNWLSSLDKIISKHAYALYQRALEDQQASSFR